MTQLTLLLVIVLHFLTGVWCQSAGAQSSSGTMRLIFEFEEVIKTNDKALIMEVFYKLRNDPITVEYMKINMPYYYKVYKAYELVDRVDNIRPDRKSTNFATTSEGIEEQPIADIRPSRPATNQEAAQSYPNQNRIPNSKIVQDYSNQKRMQTQRTSNSEQIKNYSNKDRPANQDRFRR